MSARRLCQQQGAACDVLHDPVLNKSTAYTRGGSQALGLVGLVPDVTETMETQLPTRVLSAAQEKKPPLTSIGFIYLMNLLDTNQTLFYRTLMSKTRHASSRSCTTRRSARPV